ncbi:hypothetical protein DFP72DRAFT_1076634 [Ephemerocybe angulata]|uniref:Uncharacterized protein n=1 Tax=Ephemerocybe angulata TaxID=980116 RepID=A0A8H6LYS3_9AGAR|nr:hypothetical protein DFP72DRAFT_1076634 [Tulosesus angulatus]
MQELETLETEFSVVSTASKSQVPRDAMAKVEKETLVLQTALAEQKEESRLNSKPSTSSSRPSSSYEAKSSELGRRPQQAFHPLLMASKLGPATVVLDENPAFCQLSEGRSTIWDVNLFPTASQTTPLASSEGWRTARWASELLHQWDSREVGEQPLQRAGGLADGVCHFSIAARDAR